MYLVLLVRLLLLLLKVRGNSIAESVGETKELLAYSWLKNKKAMVRQEGEGGRMVVFRRTSWLLL